ncbi:lasso peptide biosynthesis B2 protein [Actinoalloteichus spitiensis]|uniref:lasso peptide biosynthesis B2 protein n=1 Tax=Actinoalloteichus spitiensis TaxID=252394 RepID=UPI0003708490|nr:lasso peptide biosynthesis B2 protein [Actinoalloteichus spitiensis]
MVRASGAGAALGAWLLLRAVRFDRVTRLVQVLVRSGRPATSAKVADLVSAVDAGARRLPVRVACLERSLAVVLLAWAQRRAVTWCYGTSIRPPLRLHAWVEAPDGRPVGEPDDLGYRATRRILPDGRDGIA